MRGRRYSVIGNQNIASPDDTILGITATTAVEPALTYISIGSADTPGDVAVLWSIGRYTAAGTATSWTPVNLGPGTTASTTTAGYNHTVEPTYTSNAILWYIALNQRATHSLVLDPEGGIAAPATNSNGLGLYMTHASSTILCHANVQFME